VKEEKKIAKLLGSVDKSGVSKETPLLKGGLPFSDRKHPIKDKKIKRSRKEKKGTTSQTDLGAWLFQERGRDVGTEIMDTPPKGIEPSSTKTREDRVGIGGS